jgi:hypothetical protein
VPPITPHIGGTSPGTDEGATTIQIPNPTIASASGTSTAALAGSSPQELISSGYAGPRARQRDGRVSTWGGQPMRNRIAALTGAGVMIAALGAAAPAATGAQVTSLPAGRRRPPRRHQRHAVPGAGR